MLHLCHSLFVLLHVVYFSELVLENVIIIFRSLGQHIIAKTPRTIRLFLLVLLQIFDELFRVVERVGVGESQDALQSFIFFHILLELNLDIPVPVNFIPPLAAGPFAELHVLVLEGVPWVKLELPRMPAIVSKSNYSETTK